MRRGSMGRQEVERRLSLSKEQASKKVESPCGDTKVLPFTGRMLRIAVLFMVLKVYLCITQ